MTESEAWKCVFEKPYIVICDDYEEAKQIIKTALEEVQQYREIGTVEECRDTMEKQIAQKPKKKFIHEVCGLKMKYETNLCPRCNGFVFGYSYCNECGQKIKQEW